MDKTQITIALITALPPTLAALASFRAVKRTERSIEVVHKTINSRMDALLTSSNAASKAEGMSAGKVEEREEVAQRKKDMV